MSLLPSFGGYYAILDLPSEQLPERDLIVNWVRARARAKPCMLQLRAKKLAAASFLDAAALVRDTLEKVTEETQHPVPFCINDRVDVAICCGADFVHVGQDDLPLSAVRTILTRQRVQMGVGVSTHNLEQARAASDADADYIGFGPVFSTSTKLNPDATVGLDLLARAVNTVTVPVVAIGGIVLGTIAAVAARRPFAAAVISAIDKAENPTYAGQTVRAAFESRQT
jgi:thiamine-phosphate pyrophosphorylase